MGSCAVKIVSMQEGDVEEVVALDRCSPGAWSLQQMKDELCRPQAFQLIARDPRDDRLLGFVCGRLAADEAEILKIVVAEEVRQRGIGRRLLVYALDWSTANQGKTCLLELRASNTAARRLYENKGFRQVAKRTNYYTDPREDAVIMRRRLGYDLGYR